MSSKAQRDVINGSKGMLKHEVMGYTVLWHAGL